MGLTLLTIFLCCLLKSSLQITSKTKLTSTFSSKHSLKSNVDYGHTSPLDPIDEINLFNCREDEDCRWLKNSSCISMKCICKKNFININNACFERRFLGDDCLFSEECSTYNSHCMNNICSCKPKYKNVANATCKLDFSEICKDDCAWLENSYCDPFVKMRCVCQGRYILIDEKCYKKGFLNDDCSYSDQCQTSNSLCLKNKCSCIPGYLVIDDIHCAFNKSVSLGGYCDDDIQCKTLNSYCHKYGYCECKPGYTRNGAKCKAIHQISLGGDCEESIQCKTVNSYCHPYGYCECKTGYTRNGAICKPTYQIIPVKKNYQMNTFIIVICIGSILIAGIFIIVLIFAVRKRLFDIQSRRTQSRNIPELGTTAFNSNCSTIETTLEELDKPPSYEDVMRLSRSSNNLMSNEVLPQSSCPSYSESMQQRSRSSSM